MRRWMLNARFLVAAHHIHKQAATQQPDMAPLDATALRLAPGLPHALRHSAPRASPNITTGMHRDASSATSSMMRRGGVPLTPNCTEAPATCCHVRAFCTPPGRLGAAGLRESRKFDRWSYTRGNSARPGRAGRCHASSSRARTSAGHRKAGCRKDSLTAKRLARRSSGGS